MTGTVIHFTDAAEFGGAERMILTLLGELRKFGWHVVLAHHPEPGLGHLTEEAKALGITTWTVPRMGKDASLSVTLRFARRLRQYRPAIFHAHLASPMACRHGLIAAWLARLPVVATLQLYTPVESRRHILAHRLVSLTVDRYIAVSQHVAMQLRRLCVRPSRKIRVVYNAVPIGQFEQVSRDVSRTAESPPNVLALARLHPQKGLDHLLSAAALLPDWRFVVAGDGEEREALQIQAKALGVANRVEFLGYRKDVPALLRQADVFVLPSLYEGLPVSVLEAMAAGTPVVATMVAGTSEAIVHGESGLLVPPRDPAALASALRAVVSDRTLALRLIEGGKTRVRGHFSAEALARRVSEIYEDLRTVRHSARSRSDRAQVYLTI